MAGVRDGLREQVEPAAGVEVSITEELRLQPYSPWLRSSHAI